MRKTWAAAVCLAAAGAGACAGAAQALRPWREWTKKDVERVLNDSPWGRTQIDTDTSEMFYRPQAAPAARTGASNADPTRDERGGSTNRATEVRYRIRWFSSRPIRRAMAREVALREGELSERLLEFAEGAVESRTVIAVTFEADDQRYAARVSESLNAATTATLKNSTYLERRDGTRVFLQEYIPPTANTVGAALFVFPRRVGELPLLTSDTGDVRFYSEYPRDLKLNMKFKVRDMIYEGRLEY
jgi:hypothetical protein